MTKKFCNPKVHVLGSIWEGRGLKIRIERCGVGLLIVRRLDLRAPFDVWDWPVEAMRGMRRVRT